MTEKEMFKELKTIQIIKFYNIETGNTELGIPDIYYRSLINDSKGWIELKIAKVKKDRIVIPYRPKQILFLREEYRVNSCTFTLLYLNGKYYLINNFFKTEFKDKYDLFKNSLAIGKVLNNPSFIKKFINEKNIKIFQKN